MFDDFYDANMVHEENVRKAPIGAWNEKGLWYMLGTGLRWSAADDIAFGYITTH